MFHANQQIGFYTLIKKLGRGGFGEVWLAERRAKFVTTKVAVKLPLDEQVDHEAIKHEATLWEQASGHPNIVPILDADEYDGQIVIVSEYAPDGSLEEWLKRHGAMPIQLAIETTIQILDGLEFLHSRNIIHRDLKPANILLQGTTPRLADFGISRALRTTVASQSQNISGTFAYMSPEALDGKRSIQTDVWSVGVNLYQFLTGKLPFPQKEPSVLFPAIIMREFAPLPDSVPQSLQSVVAKALAKLPENRYASAGEMREDLRQILRGEAVSNFAQPDLQQTLSSEQITSLGKNTPFSSQNSQDENETVVRAVPIYEKSKLTEKNRLQELYAEFDSFPKDFSSGIDKKSQQSQQNVNAQPNQSVQQVIKRRSIIKKITIGEAIFLVLIIGFLTLIITSWGIDAYNKQQMQKQKQQLSDNQPSFSTSVNQESYSTSNTMGNKMLPPETIPTAKIVARFVWMGANFSAPIQKGSVTVSTNGKNFQKKTSSQGWLVLNGVPCNQTITISFGRDGVMSINPGESTMLTGGKSNQSTKFINCSDEPVPIGLFSWESGDFIQDDMDNVDACLTCAVNF